MKILFYPAFFLLSFLGLGQDIEELSTPTKEQLREDLTFFKKVFLSAHPKPYRFHNAQDFEKAFNRAETLLDEAVGPLTFFQLISSIMSMVGEGHSNVKISDEIKVQMERQGKILPFKIHLYQGRAFIKSDSSGYEQSLLGHEILSINGMEMSAIIDRIDSISNLKTGHNRSFIYRKLSVLKNFALAHYLYVDQAPIFDLKLANAKGNLKFIQVNGQPINFDVKFTQELPEADFPLTLDIDTAKSLAIIRITTFANWAVAYKFKEYLKFYKGAFKRIEEANVKHLVIDVRNNRGGQEYFGAQLLTYLLKKPFLLETSMYSKNVKYPILDSLGIEYNMIGDRNFVEIDTGFLVKESIVLEIQKPVNKYAFDGNVYFLTNGNCFSACNIFVVLADYHNAGVIIGEETGGNYQDTDGYFRLKFSLPYSGIKIDFPLWHIQTAVKRDIYGRGVFPDIEIQPTVNDVLNERDVMMEKVYELIEAKD